MSDIDTEWLTVAEAARTYRCSERTIYRRLHKGTLTGRDVITATGTELRIEPPRQGVRQVSDSDRTGHQGAPAGTSGPDEPGRTLIPLSELGKLLAPLAEERDDLRAQVEHLQNIGKEDAQQIGRLSGLLEAERAERERERAELEVERAERVRVQVELERVQALSPSPAPTSPAPASPVGAQVEIASARKVKPSGWRSRLPRFLRRS